MKIPTVRGVIDRRILVNFQVEPEALQRVLPAPLRPKLVAGVGIGGICLIRLRELRPRLVPRSLGMGSENAAHRIAVVLPDGGEGVFIPRRDTTSVLNALAGGRLFPGRHHLGRFEVDEQRDHYAVRLRGRDGKPILSVEADVTDRLPETSAFCSVEEASAFFEAGSLGYSPSAEGARLDGLELRTHGWHVRPLAVRHVESSFFEDQQRFPEGSVRFDSALLMRDLQHEWHAREPLYCGEERRAV